MNATQFFQFGHTNKKNIIFIQDIYINGEQKGGRLNLTKQYIDEKYVKNESNSWENASLIIKKGWVSMDFFNIVDMLPEHHNKMAIVSVVGYWKPPLANNHTFGIYHSNMTASDRAQYTKRITEVFNSDGTSYTTFQFPAIKVDYNTKLFFMNTPSADFDSDAGFHLIAIEIETY